MDGIASQFSSMMDGWQWPTGGQTLQVHRWTNAIGAWADGHLSVSSADGSFRRWMAQVHRWTVEPVSSQACAKGSHMQKNMVSSMNNDGQMLQS